MEREQLDKLLVEIRTLREAMLAEMNDLSESALELPVDYRAWKWDTVLRVLLQTGNHMREHTGQVNATRAGLGRLPSKTQRILAEAEQAWGGLLAATTGLTDDDLDRVPAEGEWPLRRILEHVRNSEQDYLEALRQARTQGEDDQA